MTIVEFFRIKNTEINGNFPAVRQQTERDVGFYLCYVLHEFWFGLWLYNNSKIPVALPAFVLGHSAIPAVPSGQNFHQLWDSTNFKQIVEGFSIVTHWFFFQFFILIQENAVAPDVRYAAINERIRSIGLPEGASGKFMVKFGVKLKGGRNDAQIGMRQLPKMRFDGQEVAQRDNQVCGFSISPSINEKHRNVHLFFTNLF